MYLSLFLFTSLSLFPSYHPFLSFSFSPSIYFRPPFTFFHNSLFLIFPSNSWPSCLDQKLNLTVFGRKLFSCVCACVCVCVSVCVCACVCVFVRVWRKRDNYRKLATLKSLCERARSKSLCTREMLA